MTKQEIDSFLKKPLIAIITTIRPDGTTHMTPVWHLYDSNKIIVASEKTSVKIKNITQNSNVGICVCQSDTSHKYVQISGMAKLHSQNIKEIVETMSISYRGKEDGQKYSKEALEKIDFIIIEITPKTIFGENIAYLQVKVNDKRKK